MDVLTRTRSTRSPRFLLAIHLVVVLVAISGAGAPTAEARSSERAVAFVAPDRGDGPVSRAVRPTVAPGVAVVAPVVGPAVSVPAEAVPAPARATSSRVDWTRRATPNLPEPRPKIQSTPSPAAGQTAADRATTSTDYQGRNHVWIPALRIDRSVASFACTSSAYPGDRVYRWGCAGRNNVYLFGHAYSVFKPLHDAYIRGRLDKGMKVYHADGDGKVSTYAVTWWKLTTPDKGEFAYAAQSTPSLTLQTCVGAKSQYRLIVRLEKVG